MTATALAPRLDFVFDESLAAREPPEATPGADRSTVRLMTSNGSATPTHHVFSDLAALLSPGDLVVVNTSAAVAAALDGTTIAGEVVRLHISTELPSSLWLVDVRTPTADETSSPDTTDRTGHQVITSGGLQAQLLHRLDGSQRLWIAALRWPNGTLAQHLANHGRPIRYRYVKRDWPLEAYQTVFGRHPGSAEMPSASPTLHPPDGDRSDHRRRIAGPDHAAHGSVIAGSSRNPVPRALQRTSHHRPTDKPHTRHRWPA